MLCEPGDDDTRLQNSTVVSGFSRTMISIASDAYSVAGNRIVSVGRAELGRQRISHAQRPATP